MTPAGGSLRSRVADVPFWYHTIDLGDGVTTPGQYDHRNVVDDLPWPAVAGRRCLDVGTFDGFFAFEMERRGAAEVVALDLDDQADLDWLPREVPDDYARGQEITGLGFAVAADALGSDVERVPMNVYDLSPGGLGRFDLVFCGTLLEHLRDPYLALERIRAVCRGRLLSMERVDVTTSLAAPHLPLRRVVARHRTWALGNVAAHHAMLHATGFDVHASTRLAVPYHHWEPEPPPTGLAGRLREWTRDAGRRLLGGDAEPPFSAALAAPARGLNPLPE